MSASHVAGHLRWGAAGEVSALFRVDPERSSDGVARLIAAVGGQPATGVVTYGPGPDEWRVCLTVALPPAGAARSVLQAASRTVLRPFGLPNAGPGPRAAAACAAAAARQARELAAFSAQPCEPGEWRAGPLREVAGCGYAVARGEPRYLACVTARPSGTTPVRWPLPGGHASWRACVAVRRTGTGPEAAFLAGVEAPDLVTLGEAAAGLSHELRISGWDAVRPGSGQLALAAALVPGAACPPLPGGLFFALDGLPSPEGPARPADSGQDGPGGPEGPRGTDGSGGPDPARTAVRVVRGPRRGLVVPLDGPLDVGRGGPGLDLADDGIGSRQLRLEPGQLGVSLRCGPGGDVLVDGRPAGGELLLRPGASLQLGRSELVLLQVAPVAPAPATAGARAAPVEVSVRVEGGDRDWSISLDAPPGATVADVLAAVCAYLGLAGDKGHCLYAAQTGALLPPEGAWAAAGIGRGDLLVVGALAPGAPVVRPARGAGGGNGPLVPLSRPPRTLLPPQVHRVEVPAVPQQTSFRARGGHWQMAAGLGFGLTAVAGGLFFRAQLWLALAGGCTSLFSVTAGLMGDRSRRRHEERAFHDRLRALDEELGAVLGRQRARWHELEPDAATLGAWVQARTDRLWERRPGDGDFLSLRLGTGERVPLLAFDGRAPGDAHERLGGLLAETLRRHAVVGSAPVCLPAAAAPLMGIAGPEGPRHAMGRWLLLQAAALHAPRDLSIAVLATTSGWGWARWLPHVAAAGGPAVALDPERVDALARRLAGRPDPGTTGGPDPGTTGGPWAMVLVDEEAAARPAVAPLLEAPAARTTAIVLGAEPRALPSRVAAVVTLDGGGGILSGAGAEAAPRHFRPEGVGGREAAALARAMAPLAERGWHAPFAAADLGLLDLLGIDDPADADTTRLWRRGA